VGEPRQPTIEPVIHTSQFIHNLAVWRGILSDRPSIIASMFDVELPGVEALRSLDEPGLVDAVHDAARSRASNGKPGCEPVACSPINLVR
jgi:hypothetical protein